MINDIDFTVFTMAGIKGKTLSLFSKRAIPDWPEKLTHLGKTYCFANVTVVPKENSEVYLGAAEYERNTSCLFNQAWVGVCGKTAVEDHDYCERHVEILCSKCEGQATHDCSNTSGLVCGQPLCSSPVCMLKHSLMHSMPKLKDTPSAKKMREGWFAIEILRSGLDRKEFDEVLDHITDKYTRSIELFKEMDKHSIATTEQHQVDYFQNDFRQRLTAVYESKKTWAQYHEEDK